MITQLDAAARSAPSTSVYSRTICADVTQTEGVAVLRTAEFDGLVCVGSIFYMKHANDTVFSEWRRVLKPGGVCVFSHTLEWQTDEFFTALQNYGLA